MPVRHLFQFLFLCWSLPLCAQELPRVLNFSRAGYAAQNQNWAVAQAPEGTLFFANNAGLLEYDGARWRSFPLPGGQVMRAVACLGDRVFAGGFAEFGYFEPDSTVRWRYHSLSATLQSDKAHREEIWHILVRPETSEVFFQSFSTIYKFDGAKTTQITPPGNIMFLENVAGRVYFQAIGRGLFELLPGGGFRFLEGSELLAGTIVTFILPEANDGLLAGTRNAGLYRCAGGRCQPWPSPWNEQLKSLQPNKAVRLNDGGLAIGTVLSGVFIFDSLKNLRFHLHRENGLQNNTVLAMHTSRSGNLWLGLDKGIDLVELDSPLTWFTDLSGRIGTVYSAAQYAGKLYVGTNQGVFYKKMNSAPAGKFTLMPGTQGQVWQLQVFGGQLLCGHNEGTFLIKNGRAKKISDITGGWTTLPLPCNDSLLVQGTYTGLVVFQKNRAGEWAFSHRVDGFSEPVKEMAFDSSGALWLAHPNRGLWRIRLSDDARHIAEMRQFNAGDGLPTDFKTSLRQWQGGLCVQAGTAWFQVAGGRLKSLPHDKSPAEGAHVLASSPGEWFEIFPGKVLYHFGNQQMDFPVALVPDYEKIVELSPGTFLFCLENGYAIWKKGGHDTFAATPQNDLALSAVEVLSGPQRWYFPKALHGELALPARWNGLRLYFSMPFFTKKAPLSWALFRSSGYGGEEQVRTSARHSEDFVELTSLPPGSYRFEVAAAQSDSSAVFYFNIPPPWWQTWWAATLWVACAAAVFFLIEKYNRRRLVRQRAHLQKEKEGELAAQRHEAEKERLQTEVDNKNRELSNATLSLIRKNETLLALKTELEKVELARRDFGRLDRLIDTHLSGDKDWEMFEEAFNQVHDEFFKKLKTRFPGLTTGDLRLAAFLKLNLSSKEIASLLGISVRGVENKRYRLRKKMALGETANLTEFVMKI
jgi:ligand-binding sensor domain-containing protein